MIISSQHTLNEEKVEQYMARIQAGETLEIVVADLSGDECDEYDITGILIDGHHRLEACNRMGVKPEVVSPDYDYQAELDRMGMDEFLAAHWNDGDWMDIRTGKLVF